MSTIAYLKALHGIIGSSLQEIERVYQARDLDFPSPDVPFYVNNPPSSSVSARTKAAEEMTNDSTVVNASNNLVAACGQLMTAIHNPTFKLMEDLSACHITASLQFVERSHTVEILRVAGPDGLHVEQLASSINHIRSSSGPIGTPLDPSVLGHILRLLATHGFFREVRPDVFANNRRSGLVDSGKTPEQLRASPSTKHDDTNGLPALVPMCTNEVFRAATYLSDWLLPPPSGPKYETPFNCAYETKESYYAWLERPENAERLKEVSRAMKGATVVEGKGDIASKSVYPWDTLGPNSVVVDVGGGIGSVSVRLALAYPNLRFIVQDRAQTIAMASGLLSAHKETLLDSGRIQYQAQDFFDPQPASVKDHVDVFLLARIMHNWDDAHCKRILIQLREAAQPTTRLIIVDQILLLACKDPASSSGTSVDAPLVPHNSPLLPNLGETFAASYHFDLTMLTLMGAKERTLHEFTVLAAATGWKITHVERAEGGVWAYTTLAPV